jgi:Protein of unknown function (DUF736)
MRNFTAVVLPVIPSLSFDAHEQVFLRPAPPCPCAVTMPIVMVVSIGLFDGRTSRNLERTDQARGPAEASIAFPHRLGRLFSPAAKARHSSREDKKAVRRRPPLCFGPDGCGPIAPQAKDRHRGCDGRGPTTKMETTTATIGTFTAADNGYTGSVKTLTRNVKAKFVATEKENDKAPDYRIFAGATEFGAAWKKTARETEREYLGQARRSELSGLDLRVAGEG